MKSTEKLFSVTLKLTILALFLVILLSTALEIKNPENLKTSNFWIKTESLYGTEYSETEIPSMVTPGSTCYVNIKVKNTGTETWNKDGVQPVCISYHWKNANETVIFDGFRTSLPRDTKSGETITSLVLIKTPDQEGNYTLVIDMVKEGLFWFETEGAKPLEKEIEVSKKLMGQRGKLEYRTDYPEINKLQTLIVNTTNSSATNFVNNGTSVFGFYAGSGYPQMWIRDSATVIQTCRYLFPENFFSSWIEAFCDMQAEKAQFRIISLHMESIKTQLKLIRKLVLFILHIYTTE